MNVAVLISLYKNDNPIYFAEAIESIINQSIGIDKINIYQAVDGKIPDDLEKIINKYKSSFYKVIRINPNGGLANALNELIKNLNKEEFIFRMDADDIAKLDRFEKQIEYMEANPSIGISGMAISEFNERGEHIVRSYPASNEELVGNIHKASPFAHPSVCFRREALLKLSAYPTMFHLCEDIALWFKAVELGIEFANLKDVGIEFRIQRNFYQRRSLSKALSELKVYWINIKKMYGWSPKLLFPVFRFISRLMPTWINEKVYRSNIRQRILK